MNWDRVKAAIKIADKLQYFFIATADLQGVPHVATAGEMKLKNPGELEVSFWFCPKTMDNLTDNKHISLIIWDAKENSGYQLLGKVEDIQMAQILDGYIEGEETLPQSRWFLTVRVDTVMEFIHALHNDVAL